jgi:hypothetical protein
MEVARAGQRGVVWKIDGLCEVNTSATILSYLDFVLLSTISNVVVCRHLGLSKCRIDGSTRSG